MAETTIFATYNGQQTMLEKQKRLHFLPESLQCLLLNDFYLIFYGLFRHNN